MPSRKRSTPAAAAAWLFHGMHVSAHDGDDKFHNIVVLYMKYDRPASQGLISLRLNIHLEGFEDEVSLALILGPENISQIDVHDVTHPPAGAPIRGGIAAGGANRKLSLKLKSPGRVLCPVGTSSSSSLSPKEQSESVFRAFAQLCATTHICIYLQKKHAPPKTWRRVDDFIEQAKRGELTSTPLDLRRLCGGRAQEADWRIFHQPRVDPAVLKASSPPPYEGPSTCRKRFRDASISPSVERPPPKRPLQYTPPPLSPTEVNTPSYQEATTASNKSSAEKPDSEKLRWRMAGSPRSDVLRDQLGPISACIGHVIGDVLRVELPRIAQNVLPDIVRGVIREEFSRHHCQGCIRSSHELAGMQVGSRLEALVDVKLPSLVTPALENVIDDFLSHVDDSHAAVDLTIHENVEDAVLELKQTRDEGVETIETAAQEQLDTFIVAAQEVSEYHMDALEDKINRRGRVGLRKETSGHLQTRARSV